MHRDGGNSEHHIRQFQIIQGHGNNNYANNERQAMNLLVTSDKYMILILQTSEF